MYIALLADSSCAPACLCRPSIAFVCSSAPTQDCAPFSSGTACATAIHGLFIMSAPAAASTPRADPTAAQRACYELLKSLANQAFLALANDPQAAFPSATFPRLSRFLLTELVIELSALGGQDFVDNVLDQVKPLLDALAGSYDDDDDILEIRYSQAQPADTSGDANVYARNELVWSLSQRLARRPGLLK